MFAGSIPANASRWARTAPSQSQPRREQQARAQHVLGCGSELARGGECAPQRLDRLRVGVAAFPRRGAADGHVRPDAHRAGVGGGLLEAAALPVGLPHQPRNVTVLRLSILPAAEYFQISNTAEPMSPLASKSTGLKAPS